MGLRTGISIFAGGSAVAALSFLLTYRARRAARESKPTTATAAGGSLQRTGERSAEPIHSYTPVVHRVPAAGDGDTRLQEVDGGVSARPAEQWHDSVEAYDAASPDDLGAEYLARAVQVPREVDEVISDLDAQGLHLDQLGGDELQSELLSGAPVFSWELSDEDFDEVSTSQESDSGPEAGHEATRPEAADDEVESEPWYAALREQQLHGARRV